MKSRTKSALPGLMLALLMCAIGSAAHAKRRTETAPAPLPDIASTEWVLQLPDSGQIRVTGVASFDGAGSGPGNMMYPAPNAVGLLAAIVTHGVIQSSLKRKQHDGVQETANQVLQPYQAAISSISNRDVALIALARMPFGDRKTLTSGAAFPTSAWRISVTPSFSLTQDQRAFIIDNAIALFAPGATTPSYLTSVRVISQPRADDDLANMWTANEASELKKEWGFLFAESIDVALRTLPSLSGGAPATSFATLRYAEGGIEKIERAQLLYATCGRIVLKTLRGKLMSVPVSNATDAGTSNVGTYCPAAS